MRTVYKYPLKVSSSVQFVDMPAQSDIIHVAMQGDEVCIWAVVNPTLPSWKRGFVIHGTGHPIADHESYIGTAHDGRDIWQQYVWHVFELHA